MDYGLNGRVVLITGGSRGIGKAAALKFAAEGAHVYLTYARNQDAAQHTVRAIREAGGSCAAVQMSLDDRQSIERVFEQIRREKNRLDVLVNNAVCWGNEAALEEAADEDWFAVVDQTVKGTYQVTKKAVPLMKQIGWGRLIHVSTCLVRDGKALESANLAGKAALHGFSRALAIELVPYGIFSNVVCPGLTLTEWVPHAFPPDFLETYARSLPAGRLVMPEDVANLIVYLGSAANSFVNGEEIRVTGG